MSSTAGLDLLRGRPLPAIGTTEAKLQQRKLDALKRGIHRLPKSSQHPYGIHLIGVGGAGIRVIESVLRSAPSDLLEPEGSRFTALAVDIGDDDLGGLRSVKPHFASERTRIETLSLDQPTIDDLQSSISRYMDFLKLEYPFYHPNPDSTSWLPPEATTPGPDGSIPRAVAKAIYGRAYYDGNRPMHKALKRFAESIQSTPADSVVCIIFGLGGGTGSSIAMDLARHLSSGLLGRRVLVTGVGIAPHPEEDPATRGARLNTVLSELDVLCDETKNQGVTQSCGELYKNPFTAGFIVVPQSGNLEVDKAREEINQQLASVFVERRGANLWEALRLLNWVAAPSTQHSAARTPWGSRWIHMFGFGSDDRAPGNADLRTELGIVPEYQPEFLELRTAEGVDEGVAGAWETALNTSFSPEAPTHRVDGAPPGSIQYLLPRMSLRDLTSFRTAQKAYDAEPLSKRHGLHSLLLEQGLLLCEPSSSIDGMAGKSLGKGNQWIAVPMHLLRAEEV